VPVIAHVRADHDEILVARMAVDDLAPRELEAVRAQVAECPACAELLADLRLIASATAQLPAPHRIRDFRLTETDAVRLRPAGWPGLLARLGSPAFAFTKPLASGLAALGIAGLILASIPTNFASSGAAMPPDMYRDSAAGAASASQAPAAAPQASGEPRTNVTSGSPAAPGAGGSTDVKDGASGPKAGSSGPEVAAAPEASDNSTRLNDDASGDLAAAAQPPSPLVVLSVILLAAAVVLGGLRLIGGRLA
jgi:anti-sigma factor RsiW